MSFFSKEMKLSVAVILGMGVTLVAFNNCSGRSFSVSTDEMRRLLSVSANIMINNDDTFTNNDVVHLTLENSNATQMYITNSPDCSGGGTWETYATTKVWTLGQKNSPARVYVKFKDEGTMAESSCESDSIIHDDVKPQLVIVSPAPATTKIPSLSLTFSASDNLSGIKSLSCKDGKGNIVSPCQESLTISGISEGPGSVNIQATDEAGNISSPLTQTWLADFTAPTVDFNSTPAAISNQLSGTFTFTGRDNFAAPLKYECQTDSAAFVSCVSGVGFYLNSGPHTFTIRAIDSAGNVSNPKSYSWTIDRSAPTVYITSGPSDFTNSRTAQFIFSGDDGGTPLKRFECQLDGGAYGNCSSANSDTHAALSAGRHTFRVIGYDSAGNASAPAVRSWLIDLTAPTLTLIKTPNKESNLSSALFQWSVNEADSGIKSMACRIDGGTYESCLTNSKGYLNLAEGNHIFEVQATDVAGNPSAVVSYRWRVDLTPPTLSFVRTPSNPTNSNNVTFEVSVSDNFTAGPTVECKKSSTFNICKLIETYILSVDGTQTFAVRATDAAGNMSSEIVYSWLMDTTGPAINFTSVPDTAVSVLDDPVVGFTVTDVHSSVASVQCGINGNMNTCTKNFSETFSTLDAGSYTYTVTATDSLGNSSSNTISWSVTNDATVRNHQVTVTKNNKVDILVVIDNSGSMKYEQTNMAQRFEKFIDQLSALDWRVAITTTDARTSATVTDAAKAEKIDGRLLKFDKTAFPVGTADFYYIDSAMNLNTAKAAFGRTIQRPANEGSGDEQGVATSLRAIQRSRDLASVAASAPNIGFFRPDANLSVLVVSDADESNSSGTQIQNNPENWTSSVRSIWPTKSFAFNSIVVKSGDTACLKAKPAGFIGNESYGKTYESLSLLTNGIIGSVCSTDYGTQLQKMGAAVVNLYRTVNLPCVPVDINKNKTLLDDVMVTLEGGSVAAVASVAGQTITLVNDLPTGTHNVRFYCLQSP